MSKQITRSDVEQAAKAHGLTAVEAISRMQMVAAKSGDESLLEALCAIKADIVGL